MQVFISCTSSQSLVTQTEVRVMLSTINTEKDISVTCLKLSRSTPGCCSTSLGNKWFEYENTFHLSEDKRSKSECICCMYVTIFQWTWCHTLGTWKEPRTTYKDLWSQWIKYFILLPSHLSAVHLMFLSYMPATPSLVCDFQHIITLTVFTKHKHT